jgi:hypothetical protein
LEEREKLRTDFWAHIEEYLDALECPKWYTQEWRQSSELRVRIVYWLIACATSEAFGDQLSKNSQPKEPEQINKSADTNEQSNRPSTTREETTTYSGQEQAWKQFPLGFSTGDEAINRTLSILRMKLLIQLENEQKEINHVISQLQQVTAGKAKPLKETKMRKSNTNSPSKKKTIPQQEGKWK